MGHAELISFLINKYFSNLLSVLITYNSTATSEKAELFLDAVQDSFQNLSGKGHVVGIHLIDAAKTEELELRESLIRHVDLGIEGYITILPCLAEFLGARLYATENSVQRLKDKYYLFLSDNENPADALINEILKLYPHHLFVSATRNSSNLTLWTQKFTGPEDNLKPIHIDTYLGNGQFLRNVELYPDKTFNMLGRPMDVATVTYIPSVISYYVAEGTGNVDSIDPKHPKKSVVFTGCEAEVVLSFCQVRNCNLRVLPYGNDNWGDIYENGSSEGMFGSVYRHETEFGIGSVGTWFSEVFEKSFALAYSEIKVLTPAPSLYPAYMTIILPFNKLIWSLIILSIFVSAVVMHVIMWFTHYMEHQNNLEKPRFAHSSFELTQFQMIAIFFQQSFSEAILDGYAARFFLTALLLAGITLENTYSGQLKSLLTIPAVTEPMDTVEKFASTNWKWAAPSNVWVFSIASSDIPHEKTMTEKFIVMSYDEMRDASYRRDIGLALESLHAGTFSFGSYIKEGNLDNWIMMKDDLFHEYSRGLAIKGWPLMHRFNTHVLWCLEHGLYNYWEIKHVFQYLDRKTENILLSLASGYEQKFPPIPLTIANISGPLYALAIGYSLAAVVFVAEIVSYNKKKLKVDSRNERRNNFLL